MNPVDWGLYGDEYIFLSTPSSLAILENKLHFNSVPLSISSFLQTPNGNAMWFLRAVTTSSAVLFLMGIQNVQPVNIQTSVNAYLLHFDEGGGTNQLGPLQIPLVVHLAQRFVFQTVFSSLFVEHKPCSICSVAKFAFSYLSSNTNA